MELKAWAAEMTAWARNAAAEIRTLKSEQESLQERVRRLEKTSKTKSATGEAKERVEVMEDFQTPKKTAIAKTVGRRRRAVAAVVGDGDNLKFCLLEHLWASPVLSGLPW